MAEPADVPSIPASKAETDYYFQDHSPDGWHEYHLRRIGNNLPELFRDGKTLRDAMDAAFLAENHLLQPQVMLVLFTFVRNAGKSLSRSKDFNVESGVDAYLTRLRRLFNDTAEPHRVFKKATKGHVVFALPVSSQPRKQRSEYLTDLNQHWKPSAAGGGAPLREQYFVVFHRTAGGS